MDRVTEVATHYSSRPEKSRDERQSSVTINLKTFNNWLKSILITKYTQKGDVVFDLCGGKGGDLAKMTRAHVAAWVLADVAGGSVEAARARYLAGKATFGAHFITADCSKPGLFARAEALGAIPLAKRFDAVSCQFALHYAFEREERARGIMANVGERLRAGGFFFCTLPNAHRIVKRLRTSDSGASFGNRLYSVRVAEPLGDEIAPFGAEYFFTLLDAVDDVPEYLVHPKVLVALADEVELDLIVHEPFHEFFRLNVDLGGNRELMRRMRADNIGDEEWDAIGLYSVFVFQKRGDPRKEVREPLPDATSNDIIVVD